MSQNEATTMNAVNTTLGTSYKNVNEAHKSLIKKGLIRRITRAGYDNYWLTKAGVAVAASEGANMKKMKEFLPKYYQNIDLKKLLTWLKFGEILGPEYLKALVRSKSSGDLDMDLLLLPLNKPKEASQLLEEMTVDPVSEKRAQEFIRGLMKTKLLGSFIKKELQSAMKEEH